MVLALLNLMTLTSPSEAAGWRAGVHMNTKMNMLPSKSPEISPQRRMARSLKIDATPCFRTLTISADPESGEGCPKFSPHFSCIQAPPRSRMTMERSKGAQKAPDW